MKKAWKTISNILVWTVVIFTVCVVIFTIVSVNTLDRNDRKIFGYKAYIVLTDSMKETDFDAGDVVMVKEVDPAALKVGDIIAFASQDPQHYGQTVTHKIKALTVTGKGEPAFITYGTTTGKEDAYPVTFPFVLGQYQFRLPKIGIFFNFLKTTPGYVLCVLALLKRN